MPEQLNREEALQVLTRGLTESFTYISLFYIAFMTLPVPQLAKLQDFVKSDNVPKRASTPELRRLASQKLVELALEANVAKELVRSMCAVDPELAVRWQPLIPVLEAKQDEESTEGPVSRAVEASKLLRKLFPKDEELATFCDTCGDHRWEALGQILDPTGNAARTASQFAVAIDRRPEPISDSFFRVLITRFPGSADEIRALARLWD